MLKDEMRKREVVKPNIVQQASAENEVGNVLAKYRNDGDPCHYEAAYRLNIYILFRDFFSSGRVIPLNKNYFVYSLY